jgi:hypothetical protein
MGWLHAWADSSTVAGAASLGSAVPENRASEPMRPRGDRPREVVPQVSEHPLSAVKHGPEVAMEAAAQRLVRSWHEFCL